jgi:ABC-type dipeptide/oligopeptide/nickel transport system ATPase subunit
MKDSKEYIEIYGAREHNLKNISVKIPRNELVVITGLSGSGKSSLAFDRQDWGLAYGAEGDPKDWMISQEVDLELHVVATK